jgi:thioredoxin-related protein
MRRPVIVIMLAGVLFLTACIAAEPTAGYDPKRDPTADLAAAIEEAEHSGKRIMLEIGGEWCHWCHLLEGFFRSHDDIRKQLEDNFIVVKVNFGPENENEAFLSGYPKFQGYPHIFILEFNGHILHSQNTGLLEKGEGYDVQKMTTFLNKWSPPTGTSSE